MNIQELAMMVNLERPFIDTVLIYPATYKMHPKFGRYSALQHFACFIKTLF